VADRDRIVDDHGAFLNRADTEDGDLRLTDDRHAEQCTEHAGVRDRERPALHVLGLQLLGAGAVGEVVDRAGETEDVLLVGAAPTSTAPPVRSSWPWPTGGALNGLASVEMARWSVGLVVSKWKNRELALAAGSTTCRGCAEPATLP
jgi:hypothetical protein